MAAVGDVSITVREPAAPMGCGSGACGRGASRAPAAQSTAAATDRGAAIRSRGDREANARQSADPDRGPQRADGGDRRVAAVCGTRVH